MRNLKNTINKQNKNNHLIDTENRLTVSGGGIGEKGEGIKMYKIGSHKTVRGIKVHHREYNQ